MKSLKDTITEAFHTGPMQLGEIISVLVNDYNITWLTPKEHPEISRFLPHSKIEDLDVDKTLASNKTAISIAIGRSTNAFGLALKYINTEGKLKNIDWPDMNKDTLQNLVICLRKILSDVENDMEKVYIKHPKAEGRDLEREISSLVSKYTPRNHYLRDIKTSVIVRDLTKEDKQAGFTYIIDIEMYPYIINKKIHREMPMHRLSIGIDKYNCLRWEEQPFTQDCEEGLPTPKFLIKWDQVSSKISNMLNSH